MTIWLRALWKGLGGFNSQFGLFLILLFGIPRFIIVLQANQIGDYRYVLIIFLCMWIAPFIFLTGEGRRSIGIKKPSHYGWLLLSFFCVFVPLWQMTVFCHEETKTLKDFQGSYY